MEIALAQDLLNGDTGLNMASRAYPLWKDTWRDT